MAALETPICDFGASPPDFSLLATDGNYYSLKRCSGKNGLLIMFICNHCPFVKSIVTELVADCKKLIGQGIGIAAICSNDADTYSEDSYPNMQEFSQQHGFVFPYLHDPSQQTAKNYGAVCTPDFFGYNGKLSLQYRGRFDDRGRNPSGQSGHELFEAMSSIASQGVDGKGPEKQTPSIGCSIKWKNT